MNKAPEPTGGRDKLIAAALQLAATTRTLASLGLREVARHAGLNPNTFYRHFSNFDDLGLAVIADLSGGLRKGLRERRRRPMNEALSLEGVTDPVELMRRAEGIIKESVGLVLEFVTEHQQAYIVGIRELHGTSPVLRAELRKVFDLLAMDMVEDILDVVPPQFVDRDAVPGIAAVVIREMAFYSLDYLEQPENRDAIRTQAQRFILMLLWGAMAIRVPEAIRLPKLAEGMAVMP
ncbi:TetR family transcriptional regulator [Sinimarinibacterium sp. NLF-5-8]|uniref:TetR family transcriptional regulator n=1 Tax=Sinimarinibacterium sp. NLF-5-8 TaxID=2698684 RepID=UPI00137BA4E5|nr:TetR family transcriptional regulator [Sinimarinibacterium sp. NLF-5-8]QHS10372.1 TetR family transcriptional regulator [Sinimarinibacterium sp. NLF-5-8]